MSFSFVPIAHIQSDFTEKFGIPRQSGVVRDLHARIVFDKAYRNPEALRGLEEYSHLWLIWVFSQNVGKPWLPTVRPPRLKGERRGVFSTRAPIRPNPIGLSSVEILGITQDRKLGPVIEITGADLLDGTPILDIKPYIGLDIHPDARTGFTPRKVDRIPVDFPAELEALVPEEKRAALRGILEQDPRPTYHADPERPYGITFAGFNVKFQADDGALRVINVEPKRTFPAIDGVVVIGAGLEGAALAEACLTAGYPTYVATRRPAEELAPELDAVAPGAKATEISAIAKLPESYAVILAVPFMALENIPAEPLAGRIVIDVMNFWAREDSDSPYADKPRETSLATQAHLSESFVVKTLNHMAYSSLAEDARPETVSYRRGQAIAGNSPEARKAVAELVNRLGFAPVDAGPLVNGRLFGPGTSIFNGGWRTAEQIERILQR